MTRFKRLTPALALLLSLPAGMSTAHAQEAPVAKPATLTPAKLYERVTPSFVAVKYTWDFELRRQELTGPGLVMSEDGLVMCPLGVFNMVIPDAQMKDFKILVPSQEKEADEIEAEFVGRDERINLAYLRPKKKDAARKWAPIKFESAKFTIGQTLISVGVLPEAASYKTYLMDVRVAATLRGEYPQVLVSGGLTGVGSVVFTRDGKAVGYVNQQTGQGVFLNDGPNALASINNPPKFFTPASDFLSGLDDLPVAGKPLELPWIGVPQMAGVTKDVSEVYGLKDQPAVQIGDIIPDSPAAKAGLKQGDIVVRVNGETLERGDETEELPILLRRKLLRMQSGATVTLSVIRKRGAPPEDIKIKTETQPKPMNLAERFYADDLGFGVREMVFLDIYSRRLPADAKGVVVAVIKPQSNAQSGGLQGNSSPRSDVIVSINGEAVTDIKQFEKRYKEIRKEKPKEPIVLVVRREGREETVRMEPPQ